jgi:hypothetical protein
MHLRALREAAGAVEGFLAAPSLTRVERLPGRLFSLEDRLRRQSERLLPPAGPPACRPGCSYCCHQDVAVSPPEALAIAHHLRVALSPAELAGLISRVAIAAARLRDAGGRERFLLKIPCPLLSDGRCIVYPLRPLACRGDNSLDAGVCAAAFHSPGPGQEAVPAEYPPQRAISSGLLWGAVDSLDEAGLEAGPLELTQALTVILEREDASEAWLRGERLFRSALWQEE